MRKIRRRFAAVASLALCGIATGVAAVPRDLDRADTHREREQEHARETARIALPRTAAGAIDVPRLIVEIRAALTRGANDIRFRDSSLSARDRDTLTDLGARFGFDSVRIREEGRRVRVDFRDGDMRKRDVRRVDERADRPERVAQPERMDKLERAEKPERADKPDRIDKPERADKPERRERPERSGRH
ncbi:MAG TPA: hypothetical protein VFB01_00690 [Burkholderiales bacterium]|nr:hypothetical protein [Burkholderiales bacterium]